MSPFIVAKVLEHLVGFSYKAKKLYSGDLLVEVNTKKQSEALLNLTTIVDVKVSVSPHRTLNTIRGVLSEDDFLDTSEEELLEGLKSSGVVAVKRIMFRKNGEQVPSKHVILTFEKHTLPETVKAGYLNCRIRPYVPNPQRCFRCQRFGHGARSCRGKETCAKCGSQGHVSDICEEAVAHCVNCGGPHPAYYRTCPSWNQEKDTLAIKVKENISYSEAKKRFSFVSKGSFADVVRRGPAPRSESRATQVSPETLAADLRAPAPRQGQQQLPPAPGGGTRAAPPSKDRPAAAAPSPSPRSPPREERASRSCSVERVPLLKEQHGTHAAPVKGGVKTNLGDPSPSSSATPPSGRGRGFPPRVPGRTSSVILHPSDTSQDMEIPTDADSQSTPGSDQDGMEWETASRKSKKKQPVVAPK
ncbi:hypothetical protein ISCGN_010882 [Ixodes scapularis]